MVGVLYTNKAGCHYLVQIHSTFSCTGLVTNYNMHNAHTLNDNATIQQPSQQDIDCPKILQRKHSASQILHFGCVL